MSAFKPGSLERRLAILITAAVALFGALAGRESAHIARHEAEELFDARMADMGQRLLALGAVLAPGAIVAEEPALGEADPIHPYHTEQIFQLYRHDRPGLLLRSGSAPAARIDPPPPQGFSSGALDGRSLRFFRAQAGPIEVIVGESDKARIEIGEEVAEQALLPFLLGLPLLALAGALLVRFTLRPVRALAQAVAQRSADYLEPLAVTGLPRELEPLAARLDSLLSQLRLALDQQRRFTADAAHELRTPLAALQAQAEAALLAPDPQAMREGLTRVLEGGRRLEHLVSRLLALARLEGAQPQLPFSTIDLAQLAEEVCAEHGAEALARGQELALEVQGPCAIHGQPELVAALLRNLVDNAVRYTPAGGHIAVAVSGGEQVTFSVSDDGPGVPAQELGRLGSRFHRLDPSRTQGAGLGLSIVLRIAEIHDAAVTFDRREGGGLVAQVRFARGEGG